MALLLRTVVSSSGAKETVATHVRHIESGDRYVKLRQRFRRLNSGSLDATDWLDKENCSRPSRCLTEILDWDTGSCAFG